jgi:hypothetical protein
MRIPDVLPGEDERTFVVPADRAASARVRGQCVDPDGAPLAEVTIDCEQDGRPVLLENALMRAAGDGTFDLGPFPPGRYALEPRHQRFAFAPVALELQPHDLRDLGVLRAALPARLSVKLLGDEGTVRRARVELVADGHRVASAGDGGERTFARVFPSRWRLVVEVDGVERHGIDLELAAGADLTREFALR